MLNSNQPFGPQVYGWPCPAFQPSPITQALNSLPFRPVFGRRNQPVLIPQPAAVFISVTVMPWPWYWPPMR